MPGTSAGMAGIAGGWPGRSLSPAGWIRVPKGNLPRAQSLICMVLFKTACVKLANIPFDQSRSHGQAQNVWEVTTGKCECWGHGPLGAPMKQSSHWPRANLEQRGRERRNGFLTRPPILSPLPLPHLHRPLRVLITFHK